MIFLLFLLCLPIGSANRLLHQTISSIRRTQAVTNCPDSDGASLDLTSTFLKIGRSSSLCTLVEVKTMGDEQFLRPIGRSYSGKDWERVAGAYTTTVAFDCDAAGCSVNLPPAPSGSIYQLTTLEAPDYSERDVAARFLEQTTFGPTQESISELLSLNGNLRAAMAQWIRDQQQMDYLSHRAIVRTRLNSKFKVPSPMGAVTQPCRAGTRYRKHMFSAKDTEQQVEFRFTNGVLVLGFDGHPYTVVAPQVYTWNGELVPLEWESGFYTVCFVAEDLYVGIDNPVHGECTVLIFETLDGGFEVNPSIRFASGIAPNAPNVVNLPAGSYRFTDQEYFEYVIGDEDFPADREIILLQDIDDSNCASKVFPKDYGGDGTYWLHDPRFDLEENTLETPLTDASNYVENADALNRDFGVLCPTAPRTFLNEDTCIVSNSPNACSPDRTLNGEDQVEGNFPEVLFQFTLEAMQAVYSATGGGAPGTRYWYVIDGLDIAQDQRAPKPCQREEFSRWRPITCTGSAAAVDNQVHAIFRVLIDFFKVGPGEDEYNPNLLDVFYPRADDFEQSCPEALMDFSGFEVEDSDGDCWLNTHPDNLNGYDFTVWTIAHPGNTAERNPIKEFAESNSFTLLYPGSHDLLRWQSRKEEFLGPVRLGDYVNFFDLPNEIRTEEIAIALQIDLDALSNADGMLSSSGAGTLVCGSPFEVENDPFAGGNAERGAFDAATSEFQTSFFFLNRQRRIGWLIAAMEDSAQLRQRVSWALAQLLVISPSGITDGFILTEAFMSYYDIFVRNAFGNYRDILKEVAYSPMMADMLTFYEGRSTAFVFEEEGNIEFADENFAREVCQLFTTGLFELNQDGTKAIGPDGQPIRVYTNDEIQEYARAWTGFTSQHSRGNIETTYGDNRVDPMRVNEVWRDKFPKMGLGGRYIGDGYPLCVDLPDKHFLKQGATFRLLGNNPLPELVRNPPNWRGESAAWLRLDLSSDLYNALCGNGNACDVSSTVVLQSDIACSGLECNVGSVRVVQVADGIFYEYVRPPCVHLAFFGGGRAMSRQWEDNKVVCGNPLDNPAVPSCCDIPNFQAQWTGVYYGERSTYFSALARCDSSETLCSREVRPSCDEDEPDVGTRCFNHYFWTNDPCTLQVKINPDGRVAVVHRPGQLSQDFVASHVASSTQTFFRVHWEGDFQTLLNNCESRSACYVSSDNMCICDVTVDEETLQNPTSEDILSRLFIGAFPEETENVFETVDVYGISQRRKNIISKVRINGTDISFRNPPHFMSISDEEQRDAHYETDATLDHYFFHPNVAPFLAVRFAQRFGVSNPSPGCIERVASAFRRGSFTSNSVDFGSGNYGDMSSMIAALLLDDEAREITLDADPSHGSLREPLLKVLAMMRSFKLEKKPGVPFIQFGDSFNDQIGQEPHRIPNVFSFFLPEFQTAGPIQQAGLTAPEGQILTSPRIIDTVNGLISLSKWGLSDCFGGFGTETDCRYTDNFIFQQDADRIRNLATASLSYVAENSNAASMVTS